MMCDKCGKNPATTHLKTVINGVASEINLCSYCAAESGYGNFGKISLANMLASMLGEGKVAIPTGKRCDCCGCSFTDIVESGRVGCSNCYKIFKNELMPSLNRLHGKALHVGSVPEDLKNIKKPKTTEDVIKELREKMTSAIKNEAFEEAAKLRDEIKKLEKGEEK